MLASLLKVLKPLVLWFDTSAVDHNKMTDKTVVDWFRVIPFIAVHAACLGVIWVGWSWSAIAVAASLYALRMFAITGFYHRYFSHRSFKTSRPAQFVFALLGASSAQRGPLWWAAHHRGPRCAELAPSTANTNCAGRDVLNDLCEK